MARSIDERFVKQMPMLFTGGQGSITHMHFDIDLSHIVHTQFLGRKESCFFPITSNTNSIANPLRY